MNVKTYLGTLTLRQAGFDFSARYLVVANSDAQAKETLDTIASFYFCEPEDCEKRGDWWFFAETDSWAHAQDVAPIGQATFLELKDHLPVRCAPGVAAPQALQDVPEPLQQMAKAFGNSLNQRGHKVSHSVLLHALASSLGAQNWHVLKAREATAPQGCEQSKGPELQRILKAAQEVLDSADGEGCSPDLTVVDARAIKRLDNAVKGIDGADEDDELREDVVEELVLDVRRRMRRHGFSVDGGEQAQELVAESNEVLGLEATEAELFEAALRLA